MSFYSPSAIPSDVTADQGLLSWLATELQRIARTKAEPEDLLKLKELSALPAKYTDGTIIFVSASLSTSLGLGGRGIYARYGSAWNRLG